MWQIQQLKIQNILSFKDESISFNQNELTLIQGVNNTDSGSKSNGSGKSTIMECIKLALTTNTIKNIKKADIVRNGESEGYLKLLLLNAATNESLIIEKFFHVKKSNKCTILHNGVPMEHLFDLNISESDKFILNKIGITSEELDNYFLISKEKYVSFFNTSDRSKKELLNQFSKTDKLDKINDLLKNDFAKFENTKVQFDNEVNILNGKIQVFNNQLLAIDSDKYEMQKDINILKSNIELNNQKIELSEKALSTFNIVDFSQQEAEIDNEIKTIEVNDDKIKTEKISIISKQLREKELKYKEIKDNILEIDKIASTTELQLLSTATCPKCDYTFSLKNTSDSIDIIKTILQDCLDVKSGMQVEYDQISKEIHELESKIRNVKNDRSGLDLISNLKLQLNELKILKQDQENQYKNITSSISHLKSIQDSYLKQLMTLENNFLVDKQKDIELEIDKLNKKIEEINALKTNIDLSINELSNVEFTINSFKTSISNQSLEYIQQKSNEFMEKIKCSYKIIINGYKLLSTGKIKDEISIAISRDGVTEESFNRFSSGERAKADISCILALNEIINYNVSPNGLDFLMIDEVLESVDDDGFINIINSLKSLNKTILLITHVSPDNLYDVNKIVVEKQNGISKIV